MSDIVTVETVLVRARDRIQIKKDWFGGDSPQRSPRQECAYYAIARATKVLDMRSLEDEAFQALFDALPATVRRGKEGAVVGAITTYNDTHIHRTVMRWFDRAIKAVTNA